MYITITIDEKTDQRDVYFGFKLINDENKNFNINNIKKIYSGPKVDVDKNIKKRHYYVDIVSPADKKDVCPFEISEKTSILMVDELFNYMDEERVNRIVKEYPF